MPSPRALHVFANSRGAKIARERNVSFPRNPCAYNHSLHSSPPSLNYSPSAFLFSLSRALFSSFSSTSIFSLSPRIYTIAQRAPRPSARPISAAFVIFALPQAIYCSAFLPPSSDLSLYPSRGARLLVFPVCIDIHHLHSTCLLISFACATAETSLMSFFSPFSIPPETRRRV